MYPNAKWYSYFKIYDYIFWGENIVFPGVSIACFSNRRGLIQNTYSFIPVCANIDMKKISFVFNLLIEISDLLWYDG